MSSPWQPVAVDPRSDDRPRDAHRTLEHASDPADSGPMFEPAEDKVYRHPTFYDIPDVVTHI